MRVIAVAAALSPLLVACESSPPGDSADAILLYPSDAGPDAIQAIDGDISMCSTPLNCPPPGAGRVSICGRLRDVETNALLEDPGASQPCDPDNPSASGPCSLRLAAYSALDFAGDPLGTPPQNTQVNTLDSCGRYILGGVQRPMLGGYLGIGIHDASGTGDRLLSGAALEGASGETIEDFDIWSLRATTDAMWQSTAGLSGAGYHERGAVLVLFELDGAPVAGVTAMVAGTAVPESDSYFSDTVTTARTTVASARTTTGANGGALILNTSLQEYSGDGGEARGCHWSSALSVTIPGVLLVTRRVQLDGASQPCRSGGGNTTVAE